MRWKAKQLEIHPVFHSIGLYSHSIILSPTTFNLRDSNIITIIFLDEATFCEYNKTHMHLQTRFDQLLILVLSKQ